MDDIREWAENFAKYTWDRLGFVYANKLAKLHETTITDDLVFQISKQFSGSGSLYMLEHATDERRNGNDLEFAIAISKGQFMKFPIQAKRLYAKQKYPRISHKDQLAGLLNYAEEIGGVPLYLLYNYIPNKFNHPKQLCNRELTPEHYGCTLVSAEHIKKHYYNAKKRNDKWIWKIPSFGALHPRYAFPWHTLFYEPERFLSNVDDESVGLYKNKIRLYSMDNLLEEDNWKVLTPSNNSSSSLILFDQDFSDSIGNLKEDEATFTPRFRFVVDPFNQN